MNDDKIIQVFREYVGIKLHFNNMDFIFKDPKQLSKIGADAVIHRRDRHFFVKLGSKYPKEQERKDFIISQFKDNNSKWVGDFFDKDAEMIHWKRMKYISALNYHVNDDIDRMIDYYKGIETMESIMLTNGDRPLIISNLKLQMCDETLAILDMLYNFDMNPTFNPLWQNRRFMLKKYKHFLYNVSIDDIKNRIDSNLIKKKIKTSQTLEHLFE